MELNMTCGICFENVRCWHAAVRHRGHSFHENCYDQRLGPGCPYRCNSPDSPSIFKRVKQSVKSLKNHPTAVILAVGVPLLAIDIPAAAASAAEIAATTVAGIAGITVVARTARRAATVAEIAVVAGVVVAATAALATIGAETGAVRTVAVAAAAAAGVESRGNFISIAAVSGLIVTSTLRNGGGLVLAGWLGAISAASAYV